MRQMKILINIICIDFVDNFALKVVDFCQFLHRIFNCVFLSPLYCVTELNDFI